MSTLERGDEIERDFYHLKAQEWACEPNEAQERITAALSLVRDWFVARRRNRPVPDNDLADVLLGFTEYVMNERVRCYNEGVDAGRVVERKRCLKIAENEISTDPSDAHTRAAAVIREYISSGGTPEGLEAQ